VEYLHELHRAQVERIPYSTLDIHLGRAGSLEPAACVERLVRGGQAGYCFQVNAAFAQLLGWLGFDVRRHRGWVWAEQGRAAELSVNHMALSVHGLSSVDNPDGGWFVDAGLGVAIHEPLPLVEGRFTQGPFTYAMAPRPDGWRFTHDPAAESFVGMDFEGTIVGPDAFAQSHATLSTSPDSKFVQNIILGRRDATGADRMVNLSVRRHGDRATDVEVTSRPDWFGVLAEVFGLELADLAEADRDALWSAAQAGQERWHQSRP